MAVAEPSPSILIVAGEASADAHGAELVAALTELVPGLRCWGAGGEAMRRAGFEAVVAAEQLAVAGITEVIAALPRIARLMTHLVRHARARRPAAVVLMDLPDFNLRLARRLRPLGMPILYYIGPQVWAWRPGRARTIGQRVDGVLCILPFEPAFYRDHGVAARFVGHPLAHRLRTPPPRQSARRALDLAGDEAPLVALLPGSRPQEIRRHLPIMLASLVELTGHHPTLRALLPVASTIGRADIDAQLEAWREGRHAAGGGAGIPPIRVVDGPDAATNVLAAADVAVVTSGTATLEAALLGCPMVVVYKVSPLTYQIIKRLVHIEHVALVNIIAGRPLVEELLQDAFNPAAVTAAVDRLLTDPARRQRLTAALTALGRQLDQGDTARTVADAVLGAARAADPAALGVP